MEYQMTGTKQFHPRFLSDYGTTGCGNYRGINILGRQVRGNFRFHRRPIAVYDASMHSNLDSAVSWIQRTTKRDYCADPIFTVRGIMEFQVSTITCCSSFATFDSVDRGIL